MMGKFKRGFSVFLTCAAAVLAIVAAVLYRGVLYRFTPVYFMLAGAAVLGVARYLIAGFMPRVAGYIPICMAAVLTSAAVWGTQLMVNQLGYVYAGLDPVSTIMTWIYFMLFTCVSIVLCVVASFMPVCLKTR